MSEGAKEPVVRRELGERVLAAAPIAIVVLDGDGAIQYVNPHFERLTGYRLDEVQGRDWFDTFLLERDRAPIRELFRETLAQTVAEATHVNPITTRAGEEREIEWTSEILCDASGIPTGLLAIGRDITERKSTQDALEASEQRLSEAQSIAKIGAWRTDLRTSEGWWSEEQYRITGYPVGTPVRRSMFLDVIHPDDREAFEQGFARVLAEGSGASQFRIVRPDGVVRDIQGRAKLTYDARGVAVAMTGTIQDITDQKCAEEAMHRASELLRTVVAGAPIAIVGLDRRGVFTLVEGRVLDKLGLKPGEVVGTSALERYGSIPGFVDAFRGALAGKQTRLDACVGSTELEVVCAPSVDGRGRTVGVIAVAFDVTERKRAEAAQQQLVDELRSRDRRKNEFIAMLSHELRNPLSAIQNALYVLDRVAPGDDKTSRATGIMMRQVAQLARLVEDLLDVSRITQNKILLQRAALDLVQLARTAVDDLKEEFARHGVQLDTALPRTPIIVNGDAARLTQVIGNLLSNAVKFTPRGGRTTISLTRDATAGRAVIQVTDTGAGIDPVMAERLFQPFSQADHTLARTSGGLGLGLAIVKGLAELHGGDVSVRSEGEGRGAEFTVRLPLAPVEEARVAPSARDAVPHATHRVLVIEDNLDAADVLREVLELDGYTVELAHDGAEGIRIARETHPDTVLCDLGLPGLSGYDVARELAGDEALHATRLVALSGYAAPEDVAKTRAAGFNEHLAKPVSLDRLRGVLERHG